VFSKSLGIRKENIKILGQPRNDMLFNNVNFDEWLISRNIKIPNYKKLIFYAPTFRENQDIKLFPFDDFEFNQLYEWLSLNNFVLILRLHQSDKTDISKFLKSDRIILLSDKIVDDIMEVLSCFDLLITDYSSIYIDYLLMNKPVLFLPYDYDEYIKNRGLLFDYHEFTPGPKPVSFNEFKCEIENLLNNINYYSDERIRINSYFNEIENGSCNRITNFIKSLIER
jgi:CDP-glycerol glycerophosphotransferase